MNTSPIPGNPGNPGIPATDTDALASAAVALIFTVIKSALNSRFTAYLVVDGKNFGFSIALPGITVPASDACTLSDCKLESWASPAVDSLRSGAALSRDLVKSDLHCWSHSGLECGPVALATHMDEPFFAT